MARHLNVLLFPGGTEVALEIRDALAYEKSVTLFAASGDPYDSGPYLYRHYDATVPPISETEAGLSALDGLVRKWKIDYIYPSYDDVGLFLSAHRSRLGCPLVLPEHDTVAILRSKRKTFAALGDVVPCPRIYSFDEVRGNRALDIFVKPEIGQGSQGTLHLKPPIDEYLVTSLGSRQDKHLFCEYLPGEEYTVDCLSDTNGELLIACARIRHRTKAGISTYTSAVGGEEFTDFAAKITTRLRLIGAWFYQVKRDQAGELKLLEAAPRIAGGMALYRHDGINFPLLSLYIHEGIPVTIAPNGFRRLDLGRTFRNHARCELTFDRVYIDLDDTLLVRGQVNTKLAALIFSWINQGIPVILLSKHDGDLAQTLARHRLQGLFADVIRLTREEEKADQVRPGSIFIDDSFTERERVRRRVGIPTFDLSMLDVLADERV